MYRETNNIQDKQNYLDASYAFRRFCVEKKHKYYEELQTKMNSVKYSKGWWQLAKEIQGKKSMLSKGQL